VTSMDLAGLVLVAGRALDLEEDAVLALADLEAAAAVRTRPGASAIRRSAPSTSCSGWSARARAAPPGCWPGGAPT
jgi:hypothetical protein